MTAIPDYIQQRLRRPIPANSYVVPGSTPVVAFGNARTATVATLGLNPSWREFLDRSGDELGANDRRLATHGVLDISDLANAPASKIEQVLQDCDSYFQRNPYGEWFDKLEPVLQGCKASYYDGSACHLDLVQWATKPTWGDLRPREIRDRLINADAEFLRQQLTNGSVKLLLANGKSVIDQLRRRYDARLMEVDGIRNYNTRFFVGRILDNVCVIAWSTYLQSRFVTAEWRTAIAGRVAQLGRDLCCIN